LRGEVRVLLDELVDSDRLLMRVSEGGLEEYRLQTKESADWFAYQRGEENALRSDPSAYESKIREQLMQLASDQTRKLVIPQGISREARRLKLHTDPITAPKTESDVPIWLRSDLDGTQGQEVLADAARAGLTSAIVFAHVALPRKDELVRAIITREAADRTIGHFGDPQTPEGQEARNALLKQQSDADLRVAALLRDALQQARVVQGGGQIIEEGTSLDDRLKKAGGDAVARLFPKFAMSDANGWDKAFADAERGLVNALEKIGYTGAAEAHPAAQEILSRMGSNAWKGNKLREQFMTEPYGWSQDAVDTLLAVLFAVGQLRITNASGSAWPGSKYSRRDANSSTFSRETAPLSNEEKRAIARLVKCKPDEAETRAPDYVAKLKTAALSGRDLVKRLAEEEKAAADLLAALTTQAAKITQREADWLQLNTLIEHMAGLPDLPAIAAERDAIRDGRLLLDDPDKSKPLVDRAADVLRNTLNQTFAAYQSEYGHCTGEINSAQEWTRLAPEDRAAILRDVELSSPEKAPKLGTLVDLVDSLTTCSPHRWGEKRDALRGQLTRALNLASKKLEPSVQPVTTPRRILRTEADLDAWMGEVRATVLTKLAAGPVQI